MHEPHCCQDLSSDILHFGLRQEKARLSFQVASQVTIFAIFCDDKQLIFVVKFVPAEEFDKKAAELHSDRLGQ